MNRIPWSELEIDEDYRERHMDKPFTGVAFEVDANGRVIAEAEFVDGVLHGRKTTWYASGQVESDGLYRNNVTHGERREWSETGRLRKWVSAENGIPLEEKEWDETGALSGYFVLSETDPLWNIVRRSRERTQPGEAGTENEGR
ncbi:MAG: hypothetical protein U0790_18360 [Isosphaeraceae bacterium]